jgi:hypothetical protein
MLVPLLVLLALVTATTAAARTHHRTHQSHRAAAIRRTDAWPLHHGTTLRTSSRGPRVAALQYLIRAPRPKQNVFTRVKGTLKRGTYTSGLYSKSTALAVVKYKYRLGYPAKGQCRGAAPKNMVWDNATVGPYFIALLRGHRNRPACWVALAAKRAKLVRLGATPIALRLKSFELGQAGTYSGWRYLSYFGLPYEPWCAIFQGYSMRHVGLALFGAQNPWYVPSIIDWGRYHGFLTAEARIGEWVLYYGDISHIGYVIGVDARTGGYETVEGNYAGAVRVVQHSRWDHLHFFLRLPWVA